VGKKCDIPLYVVVINDPMSNRVSLVVRKKSILNDIKCNRDEDYAICPET